METLAKPAALWPLELSVPLFLFASALILLSGIRIVKDADTLADRTGLGEAFLGGVLLGAMTSLADLSTSVTAAWNGYADLAVSAAMGGVAAQTLFLVAADFAYRKVNLEHAAASIENVTYAALLISLLTLPFMAALTPPITIWRIHPASFAMVAGYIFGIRLIYQAHEGPMWRPRHTRETKLDVPTKEDHGAPSSKRLWLHFLSWGIVMAMSGWLVAQTSESIAENTGLSETVVGAFMAGVATSLPELVTTISAVRAGALTLAVGNIMGGNTFDTLIIAFSDVAYREGSIYHTMAPRQGFLLVWNQLLTGILLIGLLSRQKHGMANIGFEGVLIICVYFAGALLQIYF